MVNLFKVVDNNNGTLLFVGLDQEQQWSTIQIVTSSAIVKDGRKAGATGLYRVTGLKGDKGETGATGQE